MDHVLDPRWQSLVAQLNNRVQELARRYLQELQDQAIYGADTLAEDDLFFAAQESYSSLISRLDGTRNDQREFAKDLGAQRALQGVSVEALSAANRLDFRILWRMLDEIVPDGQKTILVEHMELILTVVEQYTSEVQQSYLEEKTRMEKDFDLAVERRLSKLFNSQNPGEQIINDAARAISVDPSGLFDVLSISNESVTLSQLDLISGDNVYKYRGTLFVFHEVRSGDGNKWIDRFSEVPGIYFPSIGGISELPSLARASLRLHKAHPDLTKPTDLKCIWESATQEYFDDILPGYLDQYLSPLGHLTEHKRADMIDTVREYLSCGSIKVTSERMFCHRNTVDYRLRNFSSLTGLDVTIPAQAGLVYIILSRSN